MHVKKVIKAIAVFVIIAIKRDTEKETDLISNPINKVDFKKKYVNTGIASTV